MTTKELLGKLGMKARAVEVANAENEHAHDEMFSAEAEVIRAVAREMLPALRACGTRIALAGEGSRVTLLHDTHQGVHVGPGPDAGPRPGGKDLYLCEDGTWLELTYTGHGVPGAGARWETTSKVLTHDEVADEYSSDGIFAHLLRALEREGRGARERRTQEAQARAQRLRAVMTLLGGSS